MLINPSLTAVYKHVQILEVIAILEPARSMQMDNGLSACVYTTPSILYTSQIPVYNSILNTK